MVTTDVILLRIFLTIQLYSVVYSECNYKALNSSEIYTGNKIFQSLLKTKSESLPYSNIRIRYEYTDSIKELQHFDIIKKNVFEAARYRLESLIKVKNPINGVLRVNRKCVDDKVKIDSLGQLACTKGCLKKHTCAGFEIPDKFFNYCQEFIHGSVRSTGSEGEGVNGADIAIIVVLDSCKYLAGSASCFLEDTLDRPILGVLKICKGVITINDNVFSNRLLVQHEIIHCLGFASDKFAFYRYPDGQPVVPRDLLRLPDNGFNDTLGQYMWNEVVAKKFTRRRESTKTVYSIELFGLTLPNVLETARKHFNCPTLDGVDLQPYPELSHFHEYTLNNEIMTTVFDNGATSLSVFTLALLKDTGWYDVDFWRADDFFYGRGKGCDLIMRGCYRYIFDRKFKRESILPFCDAPFTYGHVYKCSENRKYFGICDLVLHESVDPRHQYFSGLDGIDLEKTHLYAGTDVHNEFCPKLKVLEKSVSICNDLYSRGRWKEAPILYSYYGLDSACFQYNVKGYVVTKYYGASCQRYIFNTNSNTLTIYYDDKTITCPSKTPIYFRTKYWNHIQFDCPNLNEFKASMRLEKDNSDKIWISKLLMWLCILLCNLITVCIS